MQSGGASVVAIVPTYNEPEELARVVRSLLDQAISGLRILVINAGDALPESLSRQVEEVRVDKDHYWTHCIAKGLEIAQAEPYDFVYLTNADTYAMEGTLGSMIAHMSANPKTIACAPAYIEDGDVHLLYAYQDPMGFLLYGRLIRPWTNPGEAPTSPIRIALTGGQGVLFPVALLQEVKVDAKNFPHYASDHDLWLQAGKAGWKLELLPRTGVVNLRTLSANRARGLARLKKLLWRMTSELTPESWRIMWRLRRKHLSLPVAIVSTVVSFLMRWTIGFPKILRRT